MLIGVYVCVGPMYVCVCVCVCTPCLLVCLFV